MTLLASHVVGLPTYDLYSQHIDDRDHRVLLYIRDGTYRSLE